MPAELDYPDHVERLRHLDPSLAAEVAGFTGISSVLAWMQACGLAQAKVDIAGQDEFHYDFLVQSSANHWVHFGVT